MGEVFVNGRRVVTSSSGGKSAGTAPNVCKMPGPAGPVPMPYASLAQSSSLVDGPTTVKIGGGIPFVADSKLSSSSGDEPGTAGGMLSGTTGGGVEPISYSFDVTIEGRGVVRDADVTWHNKQNTMGMVSQPGAPPSAAAAADEEEDLYEPCDICGKRHEPIPLPKQFGDNKRGRGSSSIKAHLVKKNGYGKGGSKSGPAKSHPWYIEMKNPRLGPLDGHHLICVKSLDSLRWEVLCKTYGYNVNETHNGVMLPALPQLACILRKPYHRSSHIGGKVYDEDGNMVPNVTYVDAVNQLIAKAETDANSGKYCGNPEGFSEQMKQISIDILIEVAAFRWTLTNDGIKFAPGRVGCGELDEDAEDGRSLMRCPNHSAETYRLRDSKSTNRTLKIGQ